MKVCNLKYNTFLEQVLLYTKLTLRCFQQNKCAPKVTTIKALCDVL